MQNISGHRFIPFFLSAAFFVSGNAAQADLQDAFRETWSSDPPKVEVKESSRPVFDPESFAKKAPEPDPFFRKLHKKRREFLEDHQGRREKFFRSLRAKDLSAEERQQKIAKFHRKQKEKLEEFYAKQHEKIGDHQEERS